MGVLVGWLVFWTIVGALVGAAIGHPKGRGAAGFWLGLFSESSAGSSSP
jgi:hypothetical protein